MTTQTTQFEQLYASLREKMGTFMEAVVVGIVNDAQNMGIDWEEFFSIDETTGRPEHIDAFLKEKMDAANHAIAHEGLYQDMFDASVALMGAAIIENLLDITDPENEETEKETNND